MRVVGRTRSAATAIWISNGPIFMCQLSGSPPGNRAGCHGVSNHYKDTEAVAIYSSFIARTSMFGVPTTSAAPPLSIVERP